VIREEITHGTPLGLRVREAVNRGDFADDETVLGIVMSRIDLAPYQAGFVMDGFPRTVPQAGLLDELLRSAAGE
jgi:adenylate kinase